MPRVEQTPTTSEPLGGPWTVSGLVSEEGGAPLAGATVTFEVLNAPEPLRSQVTTGADGRYSETLGALRERWPTWSAAVRACVRLNARASAPRHRPAPPAEKSDARGPLENLGSMASSELASLAHGEVTFDFVLPRGGVVRGRVLASDLVPVPGASVALAQEGSDDTNGP